MFDINNITFGFSGILSRSVNLFIDARLTGYEFYDSLDYSIFLHVAALLLSLYHLLIGS